MRAIASSILLFCLFIPASVVAQQISGRVLNEGGKAATHVKVQFKSKPGIVTTNAEGKFTIVAKELPDTLLFYSAGFEPYNVVVTEKTVRDSSFEVVLLSTRTKASATTPVGGDNKNATNAVRNNLPKTMAPGPAKKLARLDSLPQSTRGVIYKSGLLMAAEVSDFNKWKMWEDFREDEFKNYCDHWEIYPKQRYSVLVENKEHFAQVGQPVFLIDKKTTDTIWSAVTDNTGKAELWVNIKGAQREEGYLISSPGAKDVVSPFLFVDGINKMEVNTPCSTSQTVDIAVMVDATGSMSDEIDFLKIELENVLRNTFTQYPDLDLHAGAVFYRDKTDEYIVRHVDFQTDLVKVLNFIKLQRAGGGGDVPEAVDLALQSALDSLHWTATARSRILFVVTDAPPHDESREKIFQLIQKAAAKGIRIVPVICTGADRSTEFIMRSMALATNGTYVFLTDDDGSGSSHTKITTSFFNVEFLNSLLERIIRQMVIADNCPEQKEIHAFKNTPGNIEDIRVNKDQAKRSITIESKTHLKEIFISDITGKILIRLESGEKQTKWNVNLSTFPNATFLVKYITMADQWGAERFTLTR
jgi:von Willebrand factor type A domain-containing protein